MTEDRNNTIAMKRKKLFNKSLLYLNFFLKKKYTKVFDICIKDQSNTKKCNKMVDEKNDEND